MEIVQEKETTIGFINVVDAKIKRQDGSEWSRQFVRHPGAVCVLALDQDENIIIVKQPREVIMKDRFFELPAGLIDPGEKPLEAAKRELLEEVGVKSNDWQEIFSSYSACGLTDEKLVFFMAKNVYEATGGIQDESEDIVVEKISKQAIQEALHSGKIEDGKTIQALSHYLLFRD